MKERYEKRRKELFSDKTICKANRDLFEEFFEYEEKKLKRTNDLRELDEACYKTLYGFIHKFININNWFENKPWKNLTKAGIEKVWNDLEDGKIKNKKGKPFKDRASYYNKIMKSKPFQLAGKDALVKEVIEFTKKEQNEEVRFIELETFRKIVENVINPIQKTLCWVAFDIGENIFTLLQLQKRDFVKRKNPDTSEEEYIVNLPREKIKRSRKARSEITNFSETVKFLDIILKDLKNEDKLFNFGHAQAAKFLRRSVRIVKAKCIPKGQETTWKDLRSSMACHLLSNDWSTDEIRSRMGHSPSSRVLDKYVNYLAINRHKPKKKLFDNDLQKLKEELEKMKGREKLSNERIRQLQNSGDVFSEKMSKFLEILQEDPKGSMLLIKRNMTKMKELFS